LTTLTEVSAFPFLKPATCGLNDRFGSQAALTIRPESGPLLDGLPGLLALASAEQAQTAEQDAEDDPHHPAITLNELEDPQSEEYRADEREALLLKLTHQFSSLTVSLTVWSSLDAAKVKSTSSAGA